MQVRLLGFVVEEQTQVVHTAGHFDGGLKNNSILGLAYGSPVADFRVYAALDLAPVLASCGVGQNWAAQHKVPALARSFLHLAGFGFDDQSPPLLSGLAMGCSSLELVEVLLVCGSESSHRSLSPG